MKINVIGMILNNAGRRSFDAAVLDDNGKPLPAADSLHAMIMEYAKVFNGGTSDLVSLSREVLAQPQAQQPAVAQGAGEAVPYAYAVYFPDQPTEMLAHDLDDLCDDMTNREHTVTQLFTRAVAGADVLDAKRWRYAIADGGNQSMNFMDIYDDWDGDGSFVEAFDKAMASDAAIAASGRKP